jgi:hypothetical protein
LHRRLAPAAPRKDSQERRVAELLSERDRLMSEIAMRARLNALPPMLVKARTLLTRFWGRASWEARSEILAAARMLLTLGAVQPALQSAQRALAKTRRRKPARTSRKTAERV